MKQKRHKVIKYTRAQECREVQDVGKGRCKEKSCKFSFRDVH